MDEGEKPRTGRFLIVIWHSGGGTQPMIGLGRLLSRRGHSVRILAPQSHRTRVEAARCEWRPYPPETEFDPSRGRALEDQDEYVITVVTGLPVPQALLGEVDRDAPDVLVVDHQLRSAVSATELTGLPTATLVHTAYRFHGVSDDPEAWGWDFDPTNETRARLGLPPIARDQERLNVALQRRCDRTLVVMPFEFDPRPPAGMLPNLVHVGPIFEEDPSSMSVELPWPSGHPAPLVVISMGSQYMHQESVIERVVSALEGLPVRILLTTGYELGPGEIRPSPHVVARSYVPHLALLPQASMVVTHAGMGTIMAAFSCGVPMICMPLGRDQPGNAQRVEELGAGVALPPDASTEEIRAASLQTLESQDLRAGAGRMADVVEGYGSGVVAVRELEQLLPSA